MTLSTTLSRKEYAGNGVTTAFAFPYYFIASADLVVLLRDTATGVDTAQTLSTHYTVTGEGEQAGGTVTFLVAPPTGKTVVIYRDPAQTQGTDLEEAGNLSSETLETALDRAVMLIQSLAERLGRCLRFPVGDSSSLSGFVPSSVDRANKFLKFDANGNPTAAVEVTVGSLSLPVAIADGGTGASTAANARTALAVPGLADNNAFSGNNTHSGAETFIGTTTVKSTSAGATGASFDLDHESASPAVSDSVGFLNFIGRSLSAISRTYGRIVTTIVDPTNAAEFGRVQIQTLLNGVLTDIARFGQGMFVGNPTGGDKGIGTINATAYYQNNVPLVSKIVQEVFTGISNVVTTTTVIPNDDTIPQNTEGAEFMTLAITPQFADSTLRIEAILVARTANDNGIGVALFVDSVANAIVAVQQADFDADVGAYPVSIRYWVSAGSTLARTYKLRAGPLTAGTVTVNGVAGARKFGGVMGSVISITEIRA